jgi:hypothetical protein
MLVDEEKYVHINAKKHFFITALIIQISLSDTLSDWRIVKKWELCFTWRVSLAMARISISLLSKKLVASF